MNIMIKAGTRGWFEVKFHGADSVTFKRIQQLTLSPSRRFGIKRRDKFPASPPGIPAS